MNIQTKCCICEQWNIVQPLKKGNLDTSYSIDEAWRHAKWESQPPMRSTVWFRLYDVPAAAKLLQSFLTLCEPVDSSPPSFPVAGILQARTLEWVAISFSNAWKWKVKVKSLRHAWLLATPWTAAYQAPLSMGFSRQENWSGVPLPSPI